MRARDPGLTPDVWTHFDRYFATAEIRGLGNDAVALVCVSRWSPRNDWQIIRIDIRDAATSKYKRTTPTPQRIVRTSKAELPKPRLVGPGWFPDEGELIKLKPLSVTTITTLGPELRSVMRKHILAYDLIEEVDELNADLVVALTARRYRQLVNVGETSPAAHIAEVGGTPVRTIHNRLRLARERGLLPPTDQGTRKVDAPLLLSRRDRDFLCDIIAPTLERPNPKGTPSHRSEGTRDVRASKPRGRARIK